MTKKDRESINALARENYAKHPGRGTEYCHNYRKNHPENYKRKKIEYRQRNPEKSRVIVYAQRYVPLKDHCELCGAKKSEGIKLERHHPDYSKPLEVLTVCRKCHKKFPSKHTINVNLENRNCSTCSLHWPECGKVKRLLGKKGKKRSCSLWGTGKPMISGKRVCSNCSKSIPTSCSHKHKFHNINCSDWSAQQQSRSEK